MNRFNNLKLSSLNNEENDNIIQSDIKNEKVLCNHCGRTESNGIRCIGICVADNDY